MSYSEKCFWINKSSIPLANEKQQRKNGKTAESTTNNFINLNMQKTTHLNNKLYQQSLI